MSSEEHSGEEHSNRLGLHPWNEADGFEPKISKKRKGRACDNCRRRKIKCDGTETSDHSCTNCITSKSLCTYAEPSKRRVPIPPDYVDDLKARIQKLEGLLSELFPNADIQQQDITTDDLRKSLLITEASRLRDTPERESRPSPEDHTAREPERPFWLHARRFHGQSSGAMLLTDVLNMKRESADSADPSSSYPILQQRHGLSAIADTFYLESANAVLTQEPPPDFTFPPEDLMSSLIDIFFECTNPLLPILHRPTFESQFRSRLHAQDPDFGAVVLLVCAVGARHSDDLRVLPADQQIQPEKAHIQWHDAGLDCFMQVSRLLGHPLTHAPALLDLQKFALACLYLQGSKTAPHGWALSGFGIRLALEAGAHRKRRGQGLSIESQLWSRAFWALVTLDRLGAASTGRPWAVQDEDIDVDLPLAVDDEYWDHPNPEDAWKQPPGKPAIAEHFRAMLMLLEILTFALRTVYSTNKSKLMLGLVGPSWEQRVVSEIDSALNKWADSMPDHLRWNPHEENTIFFNQAALLNCLYYQIQTLVHRPFIPIRDPSSPLSFPSLAICTNAARSSSHILDVQRDRGGTLSAMISSAFTSGIVLLLNIWGVKRLGVRDDPARHMQDVFKCMSWLKAHSRRWARAQLAWNVMGVLLSAGDLPQPRLSPIPPGSLAGTKRPHDSDDDGLTPEDTSPSLPPAPTYPPFPRPSAPGPEPQPTSVAQLELPFTSADLGVLPLHPELYYYEGTPGTNGARSYNVSPLNNDGSSAAPFCGDPSVETYDVDAGYRWSDMAQHSAPYVDTQSGAGASSGQYVHPAQQYDTVRQEEYLGHDTMTMWATAPTSFEAHAWGEFAQGFQAEEQIALR